MGRRNSWNTEGMIKELANKSYLTSDLWLRGFSGDPEIELLNRATSRVQEKDYLETRIQGGFGFWDFPTYRFSELVSDIFDVWRNGSAEERLKIFGKNAAELEGRVECATLEKNIFRIWYDLPNFITPSGRVDSQGGRGLLLDTSEIVGSLGSFLSVFEDFNRSKTYPHGIVVFSPRDYKVQNPPFQDCPHGTYVLERGE